MLSSVVSAVNGKWEVKEVPTPQASTNQVLIKIHASGICYTDVHTTKGESGPEFVHVQPLTGPNAPKGTKSIATIPRAGNMKGGDGMGGGSNLKIVLWRIILIHLLFFIFNLISHNIIFI